MIYDEWDRRNKLSQRDTTQWIAFSEHSRRALVETYRHFGLEADARVDVVRLLQSTSKWPLWPGIANGLPYLSSLFTVGILSNVDDDVFARTAVASMIEADALLSSQHLGAYKPAPEIYHRAVDHTRGRRLVHVATSARDVRGALQAGISVIRLVRPGHAVDHEGPRPTLEASSLDDIVAHLQALT
jgi:2-haloalkanoic acid dehalogenase type II